MAVTQGVWSLAFQALVYFLPATPGRCPLSASVPRHRASLGLYYICSQEDAGDPQTKTNGKP